MSTPNFDRLWRSRSASNSSLSSSSPASSTAICPEVNASADELVGFYTGDRTRILIAAVFLGLNVLNLMWFAAALRNTLADAGKDGWGAAATASSAAFGALFLLLVAIGAALAYSIAGSGDHTLASGLNALGWALLVLSSFPRAMLSMSAAFGLWRAGQISNALFAVGGRRRRARRVRRHHVDERRTLGAGRRLYAVHLARHRPRVGADREPGALE